MESLKNSTIIDITNSLKSNSTQSCAEINDLFSLSDKNNLNKEEISLIEESSDGLQWCTELDYQYKSDQSLSFCPLIRKSIFESSLMASTNSYTTPPTSNYADISNHLDANLAEIDIETFKSEDINAIFLQQAGEDCVSLSRSIFEDSISLNSYRSTNGVEEQQNGLSFEDLKAINGDNSEVCKRTTNDISVDSLDMSLFEKNTSKLLMKCTKRDKKNYTIAFEGSITASQEPNDSNQQKGLIHSNGSESSQLDYVRNAVNDRKMTKSEQLLRSLHKSRINRNLNYKSDRLIQEIDKSIAKLTQSIPDLKSLLSGQQCKIPYCPVSGFIPLYDLQSSQSSNSHSSGSEFSPPRSLVKMFMQNRTSPHSSEQISPSLSYESRSQESESGNTSDSSFRPIYYNILELTREANNNILSENKNLRFGSNDEEMTSFDDNLSKNKIRFDLKQTFPIKEVDENMSDSSNTDINMSSVDTNEMNANLSDLNRNSINSYKNIQKSNDIKESDYSTKQFEKYSFCSNQDSNRSGIQFKTRFGSQVMNSGNDDKTKQHMPSIGSTRSTSTQIPIHIQDKEVQASIAREDTFRFGIKENTNALPTNRSVMTPESPNDGNKPFYVYYPNYSLPDLSFLEQIFEEHITCAPQTVYLSPTKHQLPNRDSVSVKMRRTVRPKCRPKSLNDFETLSKQNFNHIKDWDSLNILLPNEFKELIQKAKNVPKVRNEVNLELKNRTENVFNDYNSSSNATNVRMRSHRSNGQLSNNCSVYSNRAYVRNKRYSLQEYPISHFGESQTDCHNISHNIGTGCMSRSSTMPNCHNSCHCHCCHSCCHSCCRTPRQSPSLGAEKPFPQTYNCDTNSSSVDKLCQLLAIDSNLSFKKIMSIINGQNVSPNNRTNDGNIVERNEENANNCCITSNPNNYCAEDSAQNKSDDCMTNKDKDGSNFKELKQHWESLATLSPTDVKLMANISNSGLNKKDLKQNNSIKTTAKPEIARKPQLVLRRPQTSCIPRPTTINTETPTQRKSLIPVPKSGQTKSPVIYATKVKSNMPLKAFKP